MSKKYYKVIKENPLWHVGAILENTANNGGYWPLNQTDLWDVTAVNKGEYITHGVLEASPEYFQRVYAVNLISKTVYKLKEEAQKYFEESYHE